MDFHFTGIVGWIISFIFIVTSCVIVVLGAIHLWSWLIFDVIIENVLKWLKLHKIFVEFIFDRSRYKSKLRMKKETMLTKEWKKYDGNYEKQMQDIRLKDGREFTLCWPNAGMWHVLEGGTNLDIENEQVSFVRLTHSKRWG